MAQVDVQASWVRFVYPFLFKPSEWESRVQAIEAMEWPGRDQRRLQVWQRATFPQEDLLAHVRDYLNPPPETTATAYLWKMTAEARQSPRGLGAQADWTLLYPPQNSVPFRMVDLELAMFHWGVGFLTVEVGLAEADPGRWLDCIHYFRFADGTRNVRVQAHWRQEPFFPEMAGGLKSHPDGTGVLMDVLRGLLGAPGAPWWREVFIPGQLIPYAVLYVDGMEEAQVPELLYRVRNFFPSRREVLLTDSDRRLSHPALLPYADRMWFVGTLEGGAFVALDAPPTHFFRREMPDHLRKAYFLLFLLASCQRFTLMHISSEVSERWPRGREDERLRVFETIRDTFLEFTSRGYFQQVMQRENHHRVYRHWQVVLQVDRIYQEVREEIREMYEALIVRTEHEERRLERLLNVTAWILGPPALALAFLDAIGPVSWKMALAFTVAAEVLGIGVFRWLRRIRTPSDRSG